MTRPGDYQYDVFVSYPREAYARKLISPWLRGVIDRIEYWLRQELEGREPRVFLDEVSIEVGSHWPSLLEEALRTTRCLLPIWSPAYFQSPWCRAEWQSFLAREQTLGRETGSLIVPIRFHDGEWFPEEAQAVQQLDVSALTATTKAFWKTKRADELDQLLRGFAWDLARAVKSAPAFDPSWPVITPGPGDIPAPPKARAMRRL